MKPEQKKYLIIGAVLILLFIIGYWLLAKNKPPKTENKEALPTEVLIPTIDNSVRVSLTDLGNGKEVALKIVNVPKGTESVDYELSYNTAQQGLQGVIGTINVSGETSYEKKITLGTCSSGTCVYHQVVGKIKLSLKFNGSYGEKVFEKEYSI
jgi:hypothetical protein